MGSHHAEFNIAVQRVVLQTVIGNDDVSVRERLEKQPPRRDSVAADSHRRGGLAGNQKRFVAGRGCARVRCHELHSVGFPSIAAADDARLPAALHETAGNGNRDRSLPRAADIDVPDNDHGNRQTLGRCVLLTVP